MIISNNAPKSNAMMSLVNMIARCKKAMIYRLETLDLAFSVGGGRLSSGKHIVINNKYKK